MIILLCLFMMVLGRIRVLPSRKKEGYLPPSVPCLLSWFLDVVKTREKACNSPTEGLSFQIFSLFLLAPKE